MLEKFAESKWSYVFILVLTAAFVFFCCGCSQRGRVREIYTSGKISFILLEKTKGDTLYGCKNNKVYAIQFPKSISKIKIKAVIPSDEDRTMYHVYISGREARQNMYFRVPLDSNFTTKIREKEIFSENKNLITNIEGKELPP